LKESLPIVIHGVVGVLGSQLIFFSLLSPKKNKANALGEGILKIEKTEMLLEKCFTIQQV